MKLGYLVGALGVTALVVALAWTALVDAPQTKPKVIRAPKARYWPTAKLEAELAPRIQRDIVLSGIPCRVYGSQAYKRIVLVCSD